MEKANPVGVVNVKAKAEVNKCHVLSHALAMKAAPVLLLIASYAALPCLLTNYSAGVFQCHLGKTNSRAHASRPSPVGSPAQAKARRQLDDPRTTRLTKAIPLAPPTTQSSKHSTRTPLLLRILTGSPRPTAAEWRVLNQLTKQTPFIVPKVEEVAAHATRRFHVNCARAPPSQPPQRKPIMYSHENEQVLNAFVNSFI